MSIGNAHCNTGEGEIILSKDEPGERIVIKGLVVDAETLEPIKASLFLYQADTSGNYNSTLLGMPSYAKIRGKLATDNSGSFLIETIVPGNYPGEVDGKHIHVVARARGYEEWKFEFLFEGWVSDDLRKEIAVNKDAIILELQNKKSEKWVVNTTIKLEPK
ncbi:hypothetical protein [Ekhidna sp.]|uniref:dioxygenase family protein n=1 Tax=Ekhidna sp. TaxID=2608089 RepID=UPI0032EF31D2